MTNDWNSINILIFAATSVYLNMEMIFLLQ